MSIYTIVPSSIEASEDKVDNFSGYIYKTVINHPGHELDGYFYVGRRGGRKSPRVFDEDVEYFGTPRPGNKYAAYLKEFGNVNVIRELLHVVDTKYEDLCELEEVEQLKYFERSESGHGYKKLDSKCMNENVNGKFVGVTVQTPESLEKNAAAQRGRKHSSTTIQKCKDARHAWWDEKSEDEIKEHGNAISAGKLANPQIWTQEQREASSKRFSGVKRSPEAIEQGAAKNRGQKRSQATKDKIKAKALECSARKKAEKLLKQQPSTDYYESSGLLEERDHSL